MQKRKKRKIKGSSRLSFADDIENESEDDDEQNSNSLFPFYVLFTIGCQSDGWSEFISLISIG